MSETSRVHIVCHRSVNGLEFGSPTGTLLARLGEPDASAYNHSGELELAYGPAIYRTLANRLVECTFPDRGRFTVDGVQVLSMYEWLAGLPGSVDLARFRISLSHGIAYDHRRPEHGSVTVFERGHWDELIPG